MIVLVIYAVSAVIVGIAYLRAGHD